MNAEFLSKVGGVWAQNLPSLKLPKMVLNAFFYKDKVQKFKKTKRDSWRIKRLK